MSSFKAGVVKDTKLAFARSFPGDIVKPNKIYWDPWRGLDLGPEVAKARGTSTDSSALTPIWPSKEIFDATRKVAPLYDLIPKLAVDQRTVEVNALTGLGSNKSRFLGEGGTLVDVNLAYTRRSETIKFIYTVGAVYGPYVAASYLADPIAEEVRGALKSHRLFQDNALINATSTETAVPYGDGSTARSYKGIIELLSTTNRVDAGSAAVTLEGLREAKRYAELDGGLPTVGVTDAVTRDSIKGLIMQYQRYISPAESLPAGIKGFEFDGVPVVWDYHMPSGSNEKRFFWLDMDSWKVGVLSDIVVEELGKTADATTFFLKSYEAPACLAADYNGHIYQIA